MHRIELLLPKLPRFSSTQPGIFTSMTSAPEPWLINNLLEVQENPEPMTRLGHPWISYAGSRPVPSKNSSEACMIGAIRATLNKVCCLTIFYWIFFRGFDGPHNSVITGAQDGVLPPKGLRRDLQVCPMLWWQERSRRNQWWYKSILVIVNWWFLVADIISAIAFDKTGDFLASGDRAGRVVLFERNHNVQSDHLIDSHAVETILWIPILHRIPIPRGRVWLFEESGH